jgi:hypothetical protein
LTHIAIVLISCEDGNCGEGTRKYFFPRGPCKKGTEIAKRGSGAIQRSEEVFFERFLVDFDGYFKIRARRN